MTGLILFVAAASLYATILGYSRIPYAAARDGDFFKAFAHVHPKKHFPDLSLVTIAIVSIPFCFFSLGQLVSCPWEGMVFSFAFLLTGLAAYGVFRTRRATTARKTPEARRDEPRGRAGRVCVCDYM